MGLVTGWWKLRSRKQSRRSDINRQSVRLISSIGAFPAASSCEIHQRLKLGSFCKKAIARNSRCPCALDILAVTGMKTHMEVSKRRGSGLTKRIHSLCKSKLLSGHAAYTHCYVSQYIYKDKCVYH